MFIVNHKKIFYFFSGILFLSSILSLFVYGLNQGIEFKGGSLLEVTFSQNSTSTPVETLSLEQVKNTLTNNGFPEASVRSSGENDYIIRLREISNTEKDQIIQSLGANLKDFNIVGPTLGAEAEKKSAVSIILVLIAIVLFITFAFRKVSRPISSWVYGSVAIIALVHDVLIPMGVFSLLGHFVGYEIDTLFVTAILVILGFSIHDTIVVFDRVRENLGRYEGRKPFDVIVGESISETIARSINTSFTTLLSIVALYIWGPQSTQHFALAMGIGIAVGTYSSIFIGSPLLVTINSWKSKRA